MTRDDIIRMAQEAGFYVDGQFHLTFGVAVEHFAALVAAQEREACAKVCVEKVGKHYIDTHQEQEQFLLLAAVSDCANAIRARALTNLNKAAENNGEPL